MDCLKLKWLNVYDNSQITSVNHLRELEYLSVGGEKCRISDSGFGRCYKIRKLNIHDNWRITHVNHLTDLEELVVSDMCRVNRWGVYGCLKLKKISGSGCGHLISYLTKREQPGYDINLDRDGDSDSSDSDSSDSDSLDSDSSDYY